MWPDRHCSLVSQCPGALAFQGARQGARADEVEYSSQQTRNGFVAVGLRKSSGVIEHFREYWSAYWGIGAVVVLLAYRLRHTDSEKPLGERLRSLISVYSYRDPDHPLHDPGLFGRQLRLLAIGLPLIGAALVVVWLFNG